MFQRIGLVNLQSKGVVHQADDGKLELDPVLVVNHEGLQAGGGDMQCVGLHLIQTGAGLNRPTSLTEAGLVAAFELAPVHTLNAAEREEEEEGERYHALHHS